MRRVCLALTVKATATRWWCLHCGARGGRMLRLAALVVLCPVLVCAQPSISGVSGTLTHGSAVTISGSGFGTKAAGAPIKWDRFCGTNGTSMGTDARGFLVGSNTPYPAISNTQTRGTPSCTTSLWLDTVDAGVPGFAVGDNTGGYGVTAGSAGNTTSGGFTNALIDYWIHYHQATASDNIKLIRWYTSTGDFSGYWGMAQGDDFTSTNFWDKSNCIAYSVMADQWVHLTILARWEATVFIRFRLNNALYMDTDGSGNYTTLLDSCGLTEDAWDLHVTGDPYLSTYVFESQDDTQGPPENRDSAQYVQDFFIDEGFNRVYLSNSSNCNTATHTELQPWTSYGNTSIGITLNIGTFASNASGVYVCVYDTSDLAASFGPLTLGTDSGGTPSAVPSSRLRRIRRADWLTTMAAMALMGAAILTRTTKGSARG